MRPTEPGAAENASKPSTTSPPNVAEPPVSSAIPPEPPQLANLPLAESDEAVMATIIANQRELRPGPVLRPVVGRGGPQKRQDFLQELADDPVGVTAQYAKALFSREAQEALFRNRTLDKIYSVPRRFDLATLFVVSTAFGMLFTLLGYLGFSPWAKLSWCFYFSGVGFAQAALYNGRVPRFSSVLAGGLLMPLFMAPASSSADPGGAFCLSIGWLIGGLPAGYIVGTLIGGVFLVADKLRIWIARRRAARAT